MKFLFGFRSDQLVGPFDWEYAEANPLGGSETALLRVASTFRAWGHEVELLNYPADPGEFRRVVAGKSCDVFVNSRIPAATLMLDAPLGKLNYYWAHDDIDQPLLSPLANEKWRKAFYGRLNGLFLLSHYQRARWAGHFELPLEKTHLITNPIPVDRFDPDLGALRARAPLAYFASTPARGLEYLLRGWPLVCQRIPAAEVHVFSSMKVNGLPEPPQAQELYARAQSTPGVVYHGAVSQKTLRDSSLRARALAYPCCFPETSCIVAMEAMASGAVVVATELGALPETAWRNPLQPISEGWLERWASDVARVLSDDDYYEDLARQNIAVAASYDSEVVARRMSHVFRADLAALGVQVDARLQATSVSARRPVAGAPLDVVIFVGTALERWNPKTGEASGMGGSETMAWELSRHLVRLGHRVRVFGDCEGLEGTFEGVEWLDYRNFHDLSCDVLLVSRRPPAIDEVHGVSAKVRVFWFHEAHYGPLLTRERDQRIDAYLCLSAWHVACVRQFYPRTDPKKILTVQNGIDPEMYRPREGETRDPHRAIYSSCPTRGLQTALEIWPQVRAAVPDATLHVYYGFENWERSAKLDENQADLALIEVMKRQVASTEGVVHHGRVGPQALAGAFRASAVLAYPNTVPETSCITAMQAQAAGLWIVSSAIGAMTETVGDRGVLIPGDPQGAAYKAAFTEATIAALRAAEREPDRVAVRELAAKHFDLNGTTLRFEAIFRTLLAATPPPAC
jgi:glycosyltransferase involved in cell wall biosynthesis